MGALKFGHGEAGSLDPRDMRLVGKAEIEAPCIVDLRQQNDFEQAGAVEQEETRVALRTVVDSLAIDFRQVVELYYYEGYSVSDVARMLDVAETTVKWRLHKARERLRRQRTLYA